MLEFAILGLLHERPMHGYELRKELSTVCGGLRAFSYGSLYPALRRMKDNGLIAIGDQPRNIQHQTRLGGTGRLIVCARTRPDVPC